MKLTVKSITKLANKINKLLVENKFKYCILYKGYLYLSRYTKLNKGDYFNIGIIPETGKISDFADEIYDYSSEEYLEEVYVITLPIISIISMVGRDLELGEGEE